MDEIEKNLLRELRKCKNDVPVSALIMKNNKIIALGHNTKEKTYNVFGHAEINCIKTATKKLKSWHLDDCDLYVTLKPCSLCENIIKSSHIRNVYYYLEKPLFKKEYNKTIYNLIDSEYSKIFKSELTNFFQNKR